jgi:hypothetical protein
MILKIHHQISKTSKEIYEFLFNDFGRTPYFSYFSHTRSHRDHRPWGDEWAEFYKKEKEHELSVLRAKFLAKNGYEYTDDGWHHTYDDIDHEFSMVEEKYNPVLNKTFDGKPFLLRQSGPTMPKPLLSTDELLCKLKIELTNLMETATIRL